MKLRNILYYLAVIVLLTQPLWATNTNPIVTNVTFSITGTTVTVNYDVTDAEQSTVTISMEVSSDGGATWNYNFGAATGNIGSGVPVGNNKTITWTYSGANNPNFKILILANDETADGSPCPGTETVIYSGKTYHTIQIGPQCWLKENLDVGNMIHGIDTAKNNGIIEKYCYNDSLANCTIYGGLYQWNEAMQYVTTPGTKGICPTGWHIPTYAEFQTLAATVSNDGNSLKAVGQGTGSGAGTNTSGFSALLAGYRDYGGSFFYLGYYTFFWSSTEYDASDAYYMYLYYSDSNIGFSNGNKENGSSVRCAKDN
jgi:uncharacterized protein (TIGR02145 family)